MPYMTATSYGTGTRLGPIHTEEIRNLFADGKLDLDSAVWSKALGEWQQIRGVPALMRGLLPAGGETF